jgi:hypothetical protein
MSNQEEAMQRDGRNVSPNFLSWFRDYVKISYNITLLSYVCILNILITSFFSTVREGCRCPSCLATVSLQIGKS